MNYEHLTSPATQFKPVHHGEGSGFGIAFGAVRPESLAGRQVLQTITVHVHQFDGVQLADPRVAAVNVRLGRQDHVLLPPDFRLGDSSVCWSQTSPY